MDAFANWICRIIFSLLNTVVIFNETELALILNEVNFKSFWLIIRNLSHLKKLIIRTFTHHKENLLGTVILRGPLFSRISLGGWSSQRFNFRERHQQIFMTAKQKSLVIVLFQVTQLFKKLDHGIGSSFLPRPEYVFCVRRYNRRSLLQTEWPEPMLLVFQWKPYI